MEHAVIGGATARAVASGYAGVVHAIPVFAQVIEVRTQNHGHPHARHDGMQQATEALMLLVVVVVMAGRVYVRLMCA